MKNLTNNDLADKLVALGRRYNTWKHEKDLFNEISSRLRNEWIKVEDRLPEEGQKVLYYFDLTGVNSGVFYTEEGRNCFCGKKGWLCDDVTLWMPLPVVQQPGQDYGKLDGDHSMCLPF